MADLVGAVRLPEGSMRASAGTEVVIDVLVFQRREAGEAPAGAAWIDLAPVERAMTNADDEGDDFRQPDVIRHPGEPLFRRASRDGAGRACAEARHLRPCPGLYLPAAQDGIALETLLTEALDRLPAGIFTAPPESPTDQRPTPTTKPGYARAPPRMAPRSRKVPTSSAHRAS